MYCLYNISSTNKNETPNSRVTFTSINIKCWKPFLYTCLIYTLKGVTAACLFCFHKLDNYTSWELDLGLSSGFPEPDHMYNIIIYLIRSIKAVNILRWIKILNGLDIWLSVYLNKLLVIIWMCFLTIDWKKSFSSFTLYILIICGPVSMVFPSLSRLYLYSR